MPGEGVQVSPWKNPVGLGQTPASDALTKSVEDYQDGP